MATQEAAENPLRAIKNKTWILKTSIHCEGCKRKVKKILSQVHGVENIEVDIKQQKVIVTGNVNVDGDYLVNKLKKSGKNAELWPEKTEKKEKKSGQERNKEKQIKRQSNEQKVQENGAKKEQKPTGNVEAVQDPAKLSDGGASTSGSAAKSGGGTVGAAEVDGSEVKSDAGGSTKVSEGPVKTSGGVQVPESKSEKKQDQESSTASAPPPPPPPPEKEKGDSESKSGVASEKSNGGSDGVETGTSSSSGKKKKKQGQNGNNMERAKSSSAATPASTESDKHHVAAPPPIAIPANHIPPRQHNYHDYPVPLHQYGPPPVYAVNYNTAYTTSSYTASYDAQPPNSYVYTHSGREIEPPPMYYPNSYPQQPPPTSYPNSYPRQLPASDPNLYPRQPLDSFEMFSDENPNGCFIM